MPVSLLVVKENRGPHIVQRLFFFFNTSLNIVYLVMYLYMLCILAVNVISRRHYSCSYSEIGDEIKFMYVTFSRARAHTL